MKPITYYLDNPTTRFFASKWGDRLEKLSPSAKEFFIYSISNLLFAPVSVDDLRTLFIGDDRPEFSKAARYFDKEIESFRNCSQYERAKILGFLANSLAEEYLEQKRMTTTKAIVRLLDDQ